MVRILLLMVTFGPLKVSTLPSMVTFEPSMASFRPLCDPMLATMATFGPLKVSMLPFVVSFEPSMVSFEPLCARIEPSMASFGPSTIRTLPSAVRCRGNAPSAGLGRLADRHGGRPVAARRPWRQCGSADGHGLRTAPGHGGTEQHPQSPQAAALTFSKTKKTIDGRTRGPHCGISHGERGAGS